MQKGNMSENHDPIIVDVVFFHADYRNWVMVETEDGEFCDVEAYYPDERCSHLNPNFIVGRRLSSVLSEVREKDVSWIRSW